MEDYAEALQEAAELLASGDLSRAADFYEWIVRSDAEDSIRVLAFTGFGHCVYRLFKRPQDTPDRQEALKLDHRYTALAREAPRVAESTFTLTRAGLRLSFYWAWSVIEDLEEANEGYRRGLPLFRAAEKDLGTSLRVQVFAQGDQPINRDVLQDILNHLIVTNLMLDNLLEPIGAFRRREQLAAESVELARQMVDAADGDSELAEASYQLVCALRLRGLLTKSEPDAREALSVIDSIDWPDRHPGVDHATGLCWRNLRTADPGALDREIASFERANRSEVEASLPDAPRDLAMALVARWARDRSGADLGQAFQLYEESAKRTHDTAKLNLSLVQWCSAAINSKRWSEVIKLRDLAEDRLSDTIRRQVSVQDAMRAGQVLSSLSDAAAYADAKLGNLLGAAAEMDSASSVVLEGFAGSGLRGAVGGAKNCLDDLENGTAVCYLLAFNGEMAAILFQSKNPPLVSFERFAEPGPPDVWPGLNGPFGTPSVDEYVEALGRYTAGLASGSLSDGMIGRFDQAITNVGDWFGHVALDFVGDVVEPGDRLYLIPRGHLGLLPIQAARLASRRRRHRFRSQRPRDWMVDRFLVSIARGSWSVRPDECKVDKGSRALVVSNAGAKGELGAVEGEAAFVAGIFKDSYRLEASTQASDLVGLMSSSDVIHFACHAQWSSIAVQNGLNLAGLTLAIPNILSSKLKADLVFLSACTTGVSSYDSPNQPVSVGAAFAAAGSRNVVSTSWDIVDEAAAALAVQFYAALDEAGGSVAVALQLAQQRVRDGTAIERHRMPQRIPVQPVPVAFWLCACHTVG